jgi:RNA polymerase sigma-70 factor, ECF subfamily
MRRWLARAAAYSRLRSEEPRTRFARQPARWLRPTPPVPASLFQDADEPYPGHWRRFPAPWEAFHPGGPDVRDVLAAALAELPATWRDVLVARDARGEHAADVSERFGLTLGQQTAILNRARARVRQHLARRFASEPDR